MNGKAEYWIKKLALISHPEGGYYRENYRSEEMIPAGGLPVRFAGGERAFSTAIYFLLAGSDFSAFHRLHSDELWHFYTGATLTIHALNEDGDYSRWSLGCDGEKGETFQVVIKAGSWFGAALEEVDSYALVGCTVAPGFDFRDFEMADRSELIRLFPEHRALIEQFTRAGG